MLTRCFFSILICALFVSCSSYLIRQEDMVHFNHKSVTQHFIARKDLYAPLGSQSPSFKGKKKEISFKKGEVLRLILEQGDDWLRVRAFSVGDDEEEGQGRVILFVLRDFLPEEKQENYSLEDLEQELVKLLQKSP